MTRRRSTFSGARRLAARYNDPDFLAPFYAGKVMMGLLSRGSVQSHFYLFEGLGINSREATHPLYPDRHRSRVARQPYRDVYANGQLAHKMDSS
jgi:hypothetical protein